MSEKNQDTKQNKPSSGRKSVMLTVLLIVCIAVFAFCAVFLLFRLVIEPQTTLKNHKEDPDLSALDSIIGEIFDTEDTLYQIDSNNPFGGLDKPSWGDNSPFVSDKGTVGADTTATPNASTSKPSAGPPVSETTATPSDSGSTPVAPSEDTTLGDTVEEPNDNTPSGETTAAPSDGTTAPSTTVPSTTTKPSASTTSKPQKPSTYTEYEFNMMREAVLNKNQKNPDFLGYISIPVLDLYWPVMHRPSDTQNSYYLDRDYNDTYERSGEIFMDFRCSPTLKLNANSVLYGHNMFADLKFGNLYLCLKYEQYFQDAEILIVTLEGVYIYKLFSVYETTTRDDYIKTSFSNEEELIEFCLKREAMSKFTQVDKNVISHRYGYGILTLSTCQPYTDNGRYALHAAPVMYHDFETAP